MSLTAKPAGYVQELRYWRHTKPAVRIGFALVMFASLVLMAWNLGRSGDSGFYGTAVSSMSQSLRSLAFGAFDPAGTVTLDKLAGFAVPQAASVAIFGHTDTAINLPQLIEGLITVWCCGTIALRWFGPRGGLIGAAAAASTPIFVSMFGHPMEDGMLTAALAGALLCWQRWLLQGKLRWLVLSGLWIGVGFQAKMMQAWLIVPALLVAVLLVRSRPVAVRLRAAAVLGGSALVFSLAWMTAIQLVPAKDRPWIDGSTDDSEFAMVFGYNGVDRFLPGAVPGAVGGATHGATRPGADPSAGTADRAGAGSGAVHADAQSGGGRAGSPYGTTRTDGRSGTRSTGQSGAARSTSQSGTRYSAAAMGTRSAGSDAGGQLDKLVLPIYVTQIGWLYPAAIGGLLLGAARLRRARGKDASVGPASTGLAPGEGPMLVAVGGWLVTEAVVVSVVHMPHTAYLAGLGVPLALLATAGVEFALERRRSSAWPLGLFVGASGLWSAALFVIAGMVPIGVVLAVLTVVATVLAVRVSGPGERALGVRAERLAVAVTVAAVLVGPSLWSLQVLDPHRDGTSGDAYVGLRPGTGATENSFAPAAPEPINTTVDGSLSHAEKTLVAKLDRTRAPGAPLFTTDSWEVASPIIIGSGQEVATTGGFSGQASVLSEAQLGTRLDDGQLSWVVLTREPTVTSTNTLDRFVAESGKCTFEENVSGLQSGGQSGALSGSQDSSRRGSQGSQRGEQETRAGQQGGQRDGTVALYHCAA